MNVEKIVEVAMEGARAKLGPDHSKRCMKAAIVAALREVAEQVGSASVKRYPDMYLKWLANEIESHQTGAK